MNSFKLFFFRHLNSIRNCSKLEFCIILLIFLTTSLKFGLIGTGFLALPDEVRYEESIKFINSLFDRNITSSCKNIFSAFGRPADVIVKSIPALFQILTSYIFKIGIYEPINSYSIFVFNFLVYLGILYFIYKFSSLFFKDKSISLLTVFLYSVLTNSYIYIKHALPYDTSLFLFLIVIYGILYFTKRKKIGLSKSVFFGFIAFFSYLVYPGYIPLYFICFILLFFYDQNFNVLKDRIKITFYFFLGSAICLVIFEILSRFAGTSYIRQAFKLSKTITQGSFEESIVFIVKYLFEVEGFIGVFLLIFLFFLFLYLIKVIINGDFKDNSLLIILTISITVLYLAYGFFGYFFHKVVFYGRLIHQYIPFLCVFVMFIISKSNFVIKHKTSSFSLLMTIFSISFFFSFSDYKQFSYPRDIGWKYIKNTNELFQNSCEFYNSWSVIPLEYIKKNFGKTREFCVNCCYFYPVNDIKKFKKFKPNKNITLLFANKHFLNFKGYQYEGFTIYERNLLDKLNLKIKVFKFK